MATLLFDTDVIIDHLRGHELARNFFAKEKSATFLVSTITIAELYTGIRNQSEHTEAEKLLSLFQITPVDYEISMMGGQLCREYNKSHGTGLPDALIAATAQHHEATLVTLNTKHFPMVKTIKPYKKV